MDSVYILQIYLAIEKLGKEWLLRLDLTLLTTYVKRF